MGYTEAIEKQAAMIDYLSSPAARQELSDVIEYLRQRGDLEDVKPGLDLLAQANEGLVQQIVELLDAEPLHVSAPICGLLTEAAQSWPAQFTLLPEDVPLPQGWVWFEQALPLPLDDIGQRGALRAASWGTGQLHFPQRGVVKAGLSYNLYCDGPGIVPRLERHGLPLNSNKGFWAYGESARANSDPPGTPGIAARRDAMDRYLCTLFGFLQQRVLVLSKQRVLNKGAARRLAKALPREPAVQVVSLRRRQYETQEGKPTLRSVEWSCQWLVRGHWRAQYYPSTGQHRPKWIYPHTKGPADKPLKVGREKVYAVVR